MVTALWSSGEVTASTQQTTYYVLPYSLGKCRWRKLCTGRRRKPLFSITTDTRSDDCRGLITSSLQAMCIVVIPRTRNPLLAYRGRRTLHPQDPQSVPRHQSHGIADSKKTDKAYVLCYSNTDVDRSLCRHRCLIERDSSRNDIRVCR